MWAARNGYGAAVSALVEAGATVDLQNEYGSTALIIASLHNHPAVVTFLLGKGSDVTLTRSDGKTALDNADEKGHAEVVEILRAHRRAKAQREDDARAKAQREAEEAAARAKQKVLPIHAFYRMRDLVLFFVFLFFLKNFSV